MTRTRWFRPVVGLVLALAVGVAAVLIGLRFAPAQQVLATPETPATTLTVPVIAPVGDGDEPPSTEAGDDGVYDVSDAVSEVDVVVPPDEPADGDGSDEVADIVDAVADDDSPPSTPFDFLGLIGTFPYDLDLGGDPCAPAEGDPPAGCPDGGIHSTVLPYVSIDDFLVGGYSNPPNASQLASGYDTAMHRSCDFDDPDAGAPVMFISTKPGIFSYRVLAAEDAVVAGPLRVVAEGEWATTDAERAAYESSVESGESIDDVVLPILCTQLTGLDDGRYTVLVDGVDDDGEAAVPGMFELRIPSERGHPVVQVTPVGTNLVITTAIHTADEETVATARAADDPERLPGCGSSGGTELPALASVEHAVSDATRVELGLGAEYTRKTVTAFRVPEGTSTSVCAQWFPGGDAPSWESGISTFSSTAVVRSPDRILPVVTLEAVTPSADSLLNVAVHGSTPEGIRCASSAVWARGGSLVKPICGSADLATGGAYAVSSEWRDPGFSGDVSVRMEANVQGDDGVETVENWAYLNLSRGMCLGTCSLPRTTHFFVPIGAIEGSGAMCGVFYNLECDPPTTTTAQGAAMLKVSWVQGNRNGLETWDVGAAHSWVGRPHTASGLQLDTNAGWSGIAFNPANNAYRATLAIAFDRPVSGASVLLTSSCSGPADERLPVDVTGPGPYALDVPNLSPGCDYQVELVAGDPEAGFSSLWRTGENWPSSAISVPLIPVTVAWAIEVQGAPGVSVRGLRVTLGDAFDISNDECTDGSGAYVTGGSFDTELQSQPYLTGTLDLRATCGSSDPLPGVHNRFTQRIFRLDYAMRDGGVDYTIETGGQRLIVHLKVSVR